METKVKISQLNEAENPQVTDSVPILQESANKKIQLSKYFDAIQPEYFGAKGNGNDDDTQSLLSCVQYAEQKKLPVLLTKTYLIKSPLEFTHSSIISSAGKIIFDNPNNIFAIKGTGSVDSVNSFDLLYDAVRGSCIVKTKTIGDLSINDLVSIRSDELFYPGSGSLKRELTTVSEIFYDSVNDEYEIILNHPLNDSYLISENGKLIRINPTEFSVLGGLTLVVNSGNIGIGRGIQVFYGKDNKIEANVYGARYWGIQINSSYGVFVNSNVYKSDATGNGYGFYASGCCYCHFKGNVMYSRHAAAALDSSWENVFEIMASGGQLNSILSAHPNVGSVYFNNCVIYGGLSKNAAGESIIPRLLTSGATYTYVNNLTVYGCNYLVGFRSEAPGKVCEVFDVNGLKAFNCSGSILKTTDVNIRKININNVRVYNSPNMIHVLQLDGDHSQPIEELNVNDIQSDADSGFTRLLNLSGGSGQLPETIKLTNISVFGRGSGSSFDTAFLMNAKKSIENFIFENITISGFSSIMRLQSGGDSFNSITFRNFKAVGSGDGIRIPYTSGTESSYNVAVHKIIFENSDFSEWGGLSTNGLIRVDNNYIEIPEIHMFKSSIKGPYIAGRSDFISVGNIFDYNNAFSSTFNKYAKGSLSDEFQIIFIAGSENSYFSAYGFSNPNNRVYGSKGSEFFDAVNKIKYIKTSEKSQNTGWEIIWNQI